MGGGRVRGLATATVTQGQGVQAEVIEAGDQGGNGVATAATESLSSVLVVGARGDRQHEACTGDLHRRSGGSVTEATEGLAFVIGQEAEGMFLAAGQGSAP